MRFSDELQVERPHNNNKGTSKIVSVFLPVGSHHACAPTASALRVRLLGAPIVTVVRPVRHQRLAASRVPMRLCYRKPWKNQQGQAALQVVPVVRPPCRRGFGLPCVESHTLTWTLRQTGRRQPLLPGLWHRQVRLPLPTPPR